MITRGTDAVGSGSGSFNRNNRDMLMQMAQEASQSFGRLPQPSLTNGSSGSSSSGSSYSGGSTYRGSSSRGSSGRKSSGSSGGGSAAAAAPAAAPVSNYDYGMSLLESWMEQQQAAAAAAAEAKRKAAQEAYDRGLAALTSAYTQNKGNLESNYNSALGVLQDSYNQGTGNVNQQADKSQQQAYINYMLTMRDMPQLLAAQGVNGGAAESTLAGLKNNYGNARNEIDTGRNNSLAELLTQLNANKASAQQSYNNSLSDLENRRMSYQMELENALANQIANAETARYDALSEIGSQYYTQALAIQKAQQEAAAQLGAVTYAVNNTPATMSFTQAAGGSGSSASNYANLLRSYLNGQATQEDTVTQLRAQGLTEAQIAQIMGTT